MSTGVHSVQSMCSECTFVCMLVCGWFSLCDINNSITLLVYVFELCVCILYVRTVYTVCTVCAALCVLCVLCMYCIVPYVLCILCVLYVLYVLYVPFVLCVLCVPYNTVYCVYNTCCNILYTGPILMHAYYCM